MKPRVDWTLYLVVDPHVCGGRPAEDVVRLAVQGGVTVVQLRDKECSTREYVACALRLHELLVPLVVPLIINDRQDSDAALVKQAFHTPIHKYTVNGEDHWANASDPQIPAIPLW